MGSPKTLQLAARTAANGTSSSSSDGKLVVGESISLEGFGGEIETNDGEKTTLKKLVDDSKGGVVLFTYPKASTPGCMLSLLPGGYLCLVPVLQAPSVAPQRLWGLSH